MRRLRIGFVAIAGVMVLALGGCASGRTGATGSAPSTATTTTTPRAAVEATEKDFDRNNFDRSTVVDNEWFPLKSGTQLVFEGSAKTEEGPIRRRLVFTVTDLTKVVDGVRNVVVWERDFNDGELTEAELAFFAQDDHGNVWHFGQYPEEYEGGKLVGAPAWIAGREGAKPGVAMRAKPRAGTSAYAQGLGPKVNWTDRARVHKTGQKTCVPVGCFSDVLVTDENTLDEPDAHQLKYYARGVGNVRVGWAGSDPEQETLLLTKRHQLGPAALAEARREALELEQRAYRLRKNVYGHTPPAA